MSPWRDHPSADGLATNPIARRRGGSLLQQAERDADDIGSVWFEDDGAAVAVKHHGLALSECGRGAQNRK